MRRSGLKGFTIVELLIVVAVIAILASITIVSYNGISQKAKNSFYLSQIDYAHKAVSIKTIESGVASVARPIIYTTTNERIYLPEPVVGAQDVTMYLVYDEKGINGPVYEDVGILVSSEDAPSPNFRYFTLMTRAGDRMGFRIDTSASTNFAGSPSGVIRNNPDAVGRHVGWLSAKGSLVESNYDGSSPYATYTLPAHSGFNFTKARLATWPVSQKGVALLAFPEYHDEAKRKAVLSWLDDTHRIDFYN